MLSGNPVPVTAQILHMDIKHQLTGLRIQTKITQQNGSPSRETKNHKKMVLSISSYLGSIKNQSKLMQDDFSLH